MMSRFGFFTKPGKAIIETTLYSLGAAALGTGIYRAGTYVNDKFSKPPQEQEHHINQMKQPNHEAQNHSHQSEIKMGC
ncbi:Uncharacterised protein [Legionella steigerwaltii]|uniref:Uncharacterized protein n=1 Tax=Legionella steigerwaltii TaxID=460 RepID=A0A378LA69_9GAMM|nr:hypothetical protein [Legionella steigerwaltii]KTD79006.1 hypothetical protein Lstg_0963 [Legionella steigerwaltii]STY23597.1 Uncharacterised protein [Legionella steigerwaltii]